MVLDVWPRSRSAKLHAGKLVAEIVHEVGMLVYKCFTCKNGFVGRRRRIGGGDNGGGGDSNSLFVNFSLASSPNRNKH